MNLKIIRIKLNSFIFEKKRLFLAHFELYKIIFEYL